MVITFLTLPDAMVSFVSFYRRLGWYIETKHLTQHALNTDHEVTPTTRNVPVKICCDQGNLEEAATLQSGSLQPPGYPSNQRPQ